MNEIRIVVADGSDLSGLGMVATLSQMPRATVSARVSTAEALLAHLSAQAADVVILDERIEPLAEATRLLSAIAARQPLARVLVVGSLLHGLLIRDLLTCGARGYLYRADALETCLLRAVSRVMTGSRYLSPSASAEYVTMMQNEQHQMWCLDAEARAILRLLACGHHTGQIAQELGITPRRVYRVRAKLREHFGATTNEHMISRAVAEGIVSAN